MPEMVKVVKILKGEFGELSIEISRDRAGRSDPQIISKYQTRGWDLMTKFSRCMPVT